jgi:hypothetical protein
VNRFGFWALSISIALLNLYDPLLSAQAPAGYTLLYQENFDGSHVNLNDWTFRVDHRQIGTWVNGYDRAENVSEHDGALHIVLKKAKVDGKDQYTGGGLISKHQFGYGYYECLSRPFMAGKGVHTSFWQAGGAVPNNNIFEIDSYEIDAGTFMGTNNLYMHLTPSDGKEEAWPLRSSEPWSFRPDGWYLDAFEYTPDGVTYYDNGKISAHAEWRDLTAAQVVWLTALNGITGLDESKQPGESVFKYFRYYAKDYPGINLLPNGDFEYNQQAGPSVQPIAWQLRGTPDSSWVATGDAAHGKYFLHQGTKSQPYSAAVTQSLEYIMNGTYLLTATVRSSGGQSAATITVSGYGGKPLTLRIPAKTAWQQITMPAIPVSNHSVSIAITSAGTQGQWIEVDNVEFMKPQLPGQRARDPKPFSFRTDPVWNIAQFHPLRYSGDDSFIMLARNVGEGDAISVTFQIDPDRMEDVVPIERAPQSGTSGWSFLLTQEGDIVFRIGSIATHTDLVARRAYAMGHSQRVTGVFDHGVASLYLNGKLAARQANLRTSTNGNSAIGKIGYAGDEYAAIGDITLKSSASGSRTAAAQHFSGTISDLRVYNRALTEGEIAK